jgi:integrase
MEKLSSGVQKRTRDGKSHLVIDLRFRDKDGREQRYRRDAHVQTRAGAEAEARRLMEIAHATGTLELRAEAPTLRVFVEDTFKPLHRTKFRPGTWKRYEGLLRQGLLDELGDKRLGAIGATVVRGFMSTVAKRGIQARGPVNLLRTLLTAAVETGALEAMPDLPKPPPPGRKLTSAPSTEEVEAMLGKVEGWLRVAMALAAFAGLRQSEVRALEGRDVDLKTGVITVRHAPSENEAVAERSFHALRHYFLTALVRGGAHLEAVRELAGHSKLHTTQRYVHATGADLCDASGRLPGPAPNGCANENDPVTEVTRSMFSPTRSGRADSNCRPHGPEPCALPNCATPRAGTPGGRLLERPVWSGGRMIGEARPVKDGLRLPASFFELGGEGRDGLEEVSHQAVVGELEDRRFRVLVDGDDDLRALHTGNVLDGA